MNFSTDYRNREQDIADLFAATFTASEGAQEGELIGTLARRLMEETTAQDIHVFTASDDDVLVGAIIFTRLAFADDRTVFVLGPVAVATDRQAMGIGQKLIAHGLNELRDRGVDIAVTYGDPNYYSRVGFAPVAEADIPAPFPLQHPEGWLGQSLTGVPLRPLKVPARCVEAFNDPVFW
ncbi:MAG: GNAT family N-acetyltransferase [Ahrensia sp.]|nr:GNAT family N-acetyltransferase [Ahrensia sp.]